MKLIEILEQIVAKEFRSGHVPLVMLASGHVALDETRMYFSDKDLEIPIEKRNKWYDLHILDSQYLICKRGFRRMFYTNKFTGWKHEAGNC